MKNVISKSKYVFMLLIIAFAYSCSPEDGLNGLDGVNGIDGINGVSGNDGIDGENGQNGSDGQDGNNGEDGTDGQNGNNGEDGADGQNGNNGEDGQNGSDGQDGADGNNGTDGQNGNNGQDGSDGQDGNNGTDGQDGQDAVTYSIGDYTQGGIIFWLDESEQHGLVCDIRDLNGGNAIRWYAGTNGATRATGNGIYAGENNTTIIISALVAIGDDGNDYAALLCNDLELYQNGNRYGDWYLPSREEILRLRSNRDLINDVALLNGGTSIQTSLDYWTSTENSTATAWSYDLGGNSGGTRGKSSIFFVRAIRAF